MRYFHCSEVEHPNGTVLTGPALRNATSQWSAAERTYDPRRVYVFVGDADPLLLRDASVPGGPTFVYEVEPHGEMQLDQAGGLWRSMSCESAVVLACPYGPETEISLDGECGG